MKRNAALPVPKSDLQNQTIDKAAGRCESKRFETVLNVGFKL